MVSLSICLMYFLAFLNSITFCLSYVNFIGSNSFTLLKSTTINEDLKTTIDNSNIKVPSNGIISYIGNTTPLSSDEKRWSTHHLTYNPPSKGQRFLTKFNLWRQLFWKKIPGKVVLKAKVGGEIQLETPNQGFSFGSSIDYENIQSLNDIQNMFQLAANDPRILSVFINIERLACGYAKLQEIRRSMDYFRQSNKTIYGYCESGSEKEFYLALGCNEIFVPPEGGFDLRGFSASASFFRGIFDNIGIEPQVQRIGKYKSFGDTFNRTVISDAQREVISSLLSEASDYWIDSVSQTLHKPKNDVLSLWNDKHVRSSYDLKDKAFVNGVSYVDMIEEYIKSKYRRNKVSLIQRIIGFFNGIDYSFLDTSNVTIGSYNLLNDFFDNPRRSLQLSSINSTVESKSKKYDDPNLLPVGLYLRKMRAGSRIIQGLPLKETRGGPRIAIINAVGGINSGKSGNGPTGKTLGSETLIKQLREAGRDSNIKAVVLRIDSPGGSALASDVMWREIRLLARSKPVIASQVDVAASGGYYLSMACDQIVSEELSITGSIGVVTSKFNAAQLNKKVGLGTETISRGRYAEILSTSRGFSKEEEEYFESGAWKAYTSFITKAAYSRNMSVEAMNEVAQGRVWTGRQALNIGLVDHIGGLHKAIEIAILTSNYTFNRYGNVTRSFSIPVQVIKEQRSGFPFPFGGASSSSFSTSSPLLLDSTKYLADDSIFATGLVQLESLGMKTNKLSELSSLLPKETNYWLATNKLPEFLINLFENFIN